MKKRFIVTGGAGFIGAHLLARLIQEGFRVTVIDNLSTGSRGNLKPEADFIQGDISQEEDIAKLPTGNVKGVFHLAAQSSAEISFENPYADFKTNVEGTLLLLDWCKRNNIKRFIFTSSMGVYGNSNDSCFSESSSCNPESFYGVSKLAAENYIRLYARMGLETTILRLFNVYGPRQNLENKKQGMASIYMSYLLENEPILVKGSLDRIRDQTYVTDCIEAMMVCLQKKISINSTYNIATGRKTNVRDLIATMLEVSGNSIDSYPVQVLEGTPQDIFSSYADVSKAKEELGFSPKYSLKEGLSRMYKSYIGKEK